MRSRIAAALLAGAALVTASVSWAYPPRTDVIWARVSPTPIVLDGKLDEAAWAQAESKTILYNRATNPSLGNGIPGSGWKDEGGIATPDRTNATVKFLAFGNRLYMGVTVNDYSIGGSKDFNKFDGFLMGVKDHTISGPSPVREYLYAWWYPDDPDTLDPGQGPAFKGLWAELPVGSPRTPTQIDAWDAVTTVKGVANRDSVNHVFTPDTSYTVEMMFNLTPMGYDITQPNGDIFEWNISIYDCDGNWPQNLFRLGYNRTWWQSPWSADEWYHEVRVCSKPSVTTSSGPVPELAPELIIPNASGFAHPTIDGQLLEPVWASAPSLHIKFGDPSVRNAYTGVGKWRSGQYEVDFQPLVEPNPPPVDDPLDATVKYFFKDWYLYLGFNVTDQVVQYSTVEDKYDGFLVSINDRGAQQPFDNLVLAPRKLTCRVGSGGAADPQDYLLSLVNSGGAQVAMHMNPGTVVSNADADPGPNPDNGYTAELKIDLRQLGYDWKLLDNVLFLGIDMYDGDTFIPLENAYGSRTWWFREREGEASSAWAYMDPTVGVVDVSGEPPKPPTRLELSSNVPNPFREETTVYFALPSDSRVRLEVFDLQGRTVASRDLGVMPAGPQQAHLERGTMGPGLYLYRVRVEDARSGAPLGVRSGKMMVVR